MSTPIPYKFDLISFKSKTEPRLLATDKIWDTQKIWELCITSTQEIKLYSNKEDDKYTFTFPLIFETKEDEQKLYDAIKNRQETILDINVGVR